MGQEGAMIETGRFRRTAAAGVIVLLLAAAFATAAVAHVERTSYWPDPRPDTSVKPAAGGRVPKARSLASALDRRRVGDTRGVCRPDSLQLTRAAITKARTQGVVIRPSVPARK